MPPEHFKITDTMPLSTPSAKKVWVNFLPNIDLGHLLTMIGFGVAFFAQWNVMDQRITRAEMENQQQNAVINEVKGDIKEIKTVVLNIQLQQAAATAVRQSQTVK